MVAQLPLPPLVAIVEDDADVRASLDSLFRSAGLLTESFTSAEELLARSDLDVVSSIVSDLHMPGIGGLGLQKELAKRLWAGKLIIITGCPTSIEREMALATGIDAFFAKPVDPDDLLHLIGKF